MSNAKLLTEVRLVGRGGQGVVTAGELLGAAALAGGANAQAIPTFGPERRGALSSCVVRVSPEEILLKHSVARPDILLCLDPTIWQVNDVRQGLADDATLIFNSNQSQESLRSALDERGFFASNGATVFVLDATAIALEQLGKPITNTAMLGAIAGATGLISLDALGACYRERFGPRAEVNLACARAAAERLTRLPSAA
ncbi:MAG: 2-oxoacid:acceptor oxidoreductase family protein [Deltaproteobacteria bacterium]|nr:2-oxoacid:acceptor oxidoreductase family protein [Deltaproteobacteria bacterium]